MNALTQLLDRNRDWARRQRELDPGFFERLASRHAPEYLWIGCADARVPANQIADIPPGEMFVHRNIANVVTHSDFNCQAVLQFAVEFLKVRHVIVCGHYGCSGVMSALTRTRVGLADNWLGYVRDVYDRHAERLASIPDEATRYDRLCELNVLDQAWNVCQSMVVQDAWQRGQSLTVHAWIYGVGNGLVHDLDFSVASPDAVGLAVERAHAALFGCDSDGDV